MSDWDSSFTDGTPTQAIRGGAIVAVSQIGRTLLVLCVTVLLARLLTPEEFGSVAVIMAVLALGLVMQDAGLTAATVQREKLSTQAVSTMFWINASFGLGLTMLFALLSHPLAVFLGHPHLTPLFQVASLTYVLNGLVTQHRALLQRSMRFATRARIDIGSALIGGLSAISLAAADFGYWALIAQTLTTDVVALILLVSVVRWRLRRPTLTREVLEMVRFGASTLGFQIVLTISFNLHVVLLGRNLGTSAAGIYTRAYALASVPQGLLQTAAGHVALPSLSRAQNADEFAAFYYKGVQLLVLVAMPMTLAFAIFSDAIALIVYGPQWTDVTTLLQIFSVSLAVLPLLNGAGPVFLARNQPHRMLRWGIFGACVTILGTLVGLHWGTVGVAWGWTVAMLVLVLPCLVYTYRGSDLTIRQLARTVGGIYAAALCTLPVGWVARRSLGELPQLAELSLGFGVTLLAYILLCYFAFGQKPLIRQVAQRLTSRA